MRIDEYMPMNEKTAGVKLEEEQYYPLATRRPRLTLMHLNKLRKIRERRKFERLTRSANMPKIYWPIIEPKEKDEKDDA